MSQYTSVRNNYLDKKVIDLENELIQLKATQNYGMNDVQIFQSNTVTENSVNVKVISDVGGTVYGTGTNILKLRFVGDKPSKTGVGSLQIKPSYSGVFSDFGYLKKYRGDKPNVLEWIVCPYIYSENGYRSFSVSYSVSSNDKGTLSVVSSYSILQYFDWISGSGA